MLAMAIFKKWWKVRETIAATVEIEIATETGIERGETAEVGQEIEIENVAEEVALEIENIEKTTETEEENHPYIGMYPLQDLSISRLCNIKQCKPQDKFQQP